MKVSYNWLSEFLPAIPSIEDTADILTNIGLEVSGVEQYESVPGGLQGLVVGEVVDKWPHPNADRLSLTKVFIGEEDPLQIVCGAPNVEKGQKVVVATVGTRLYPLDGDPFKIKKGKIRGEASFGMICAEDEIGLGTNHDGILVLDDDVKIGSPVSDYFQIEKDYIIEIDLTPNRSDAISHMGVARDLQAYLNNSEDNLKVTSITLPESSKIDTSKISTQISVEIEDKNDCYRYAGRVVSGIKVGPSPTWLKNRLTSLGLASINNVVDITNYVMMETGQPLHAFDVNKIKGNRVLVRNAKEGTNFVTLDEKERALTSSDLMICNDQDEMCIAGVFGGLSSGVSDYTTSVFIESAVFDPVKVRKTARYHGLNTDASYRFERGVDPEQVLVALNRAVQLLVENCGAFVDSDLIDVYPQPIQEVVVDFQVSKAQLLIGDNIPKDKIRNILISLDIKIISEKDDLWKLQIPAYRHDVQRQADVVEEVLRIYGYNRIKQPGQFPISFSEPKKTKPESIQNKISDLLASVNFQEIMNNSLTSSKYYTEDDKRDSDVVTILNPLSSELDVLRKSMVYSGLESMQLNHNQRLKDLKLFEFGRTYQKGKSGFEENSWLSVWMMGNIQKPNWKNPEKSMDFFDLKACVEKVLKTTGGLLDRLVAEELSNDKSLQYGLSYVFQGQPIARIGKLRNSIAEKFDLENEVFYGCIHWNLVLDFIRNHDSKKFKDFNKFPGMRRDLSLLVSSGTTFERIQHSIHGVQNKWLRDIDLFDVYEGDKLPQGKKSYAISLSFQDAEKTLTDKAVDKVMDKIIARVKQDLQAELR